MNNPKPSPCLQWVGGKTKLLPEIIKRTPETFDRYVEPFLGGGAVFFEMSAAGRIREAILADSNRRLINLYLQIKTDVEPLIEELNVLQSEPCSESRYADLRAEFNGAPPGLRSAALFIFLNKTCFNGLYREAKKTGNMNAPWGHKEGIVKVFDPILMRADRDALSKALVLEEDFAVVLKSTRPGDFVYIDPPYVPVSTTSSFAEYTKEGFGLSAHKILAELCMEMNARGIRFLASNADVPLVRELYSGLKIERVMVGRSVNSDGSKRGKVPEVLISNNI
jgi:DNA adenine methylase